MSSLSAVHIQFDNIHYPINYVKVKDEHFKVDQDAELFLENYATCITRAARSRAKTYTIFGISSFMFFSSLIATCYYNSVVLNACVLGSVLLMVGPGMALADETIQWHVQANDMGRACIKMIGRHRLELIPEFQIDRTRTRVVEILHQYYKCWDWICHKTKTPYWADSNRLVPYSSLTQMSEELNVE